MAGLAWLECPAGPDTPVLVLLHGFGGRAAQWRAIMAMLQARGISTLAFDLPGHGASPIPDLAADDAARKPPAAVAAHAVLAGLSRWEDADGPDASPARRWHVAGHSFGGAVAAIMAMLASDKLASAAFIAPGGFGPEINTAAMHAFAQAATTIGMRRALADFYGPDFVIDDRVAAGHLEARMAPGSADHLARLAAIIAPHEGGQGRLPLERVGASGVRAAVLWGEADAILPASRATALPCASVTLLQGIGHMPHEECPQRLAQWLEEHVNGSAKI
jgi:pimeloyl-ACP methyl ester carboxylesterase